MSDARFEKLEERVAWLEHHVTQQDKAMLEQAKRLDRLQAELVRLRERAPGAGEMGYGLSVDAGDVSAAAERPPHY
jgi:SlyX protein